MFAPNGILAVPLRIASGVRMKILETWARGVPVVATPAACRGLVVENGDGVLVAATPAEFAEAVESLHGRPDTRRHQVERGRRMLIERHDPAAIAEQVEGLYRSAVSGYVSRVDRSP